MLLGEYEHTIDDKNRLTLPAKFREALPGGLVVTRGMDGCLYAYPRADWERLVEARLAALDPLSREGAHDAALLLLRRRRGRARQAGPRDAAGAARSSTRGSSREVVVAGVDDHLEIWDRAAWREHVKEVEGSAEDVAERLAAQARLTTSPSSPTRCARLLAVQPGETVVDATFGAGGHADAARGRPAAAAAS